MTGTVHADYRAYGGPPAKGVITFGTNTTDQQLRDPAGNVIYTGPQKFRLVAGELEIELPATDDPAFAETNWTWWARIELDGLPPVLRWFELPDGDTVDLADIAGELAPGDPLTHPISYADVIADIGDPESAIGEALAASVATSAIVPSATAVGVGIDPTGVADSTAALQAKIDALPTGGTLYIPNGTYKLTDALVVTDACTLFGESSSGNWTGLGAGGSFDVPIVSPYLRGVVLNQTVAAKDVITITSSGHTVHLENLGLMFTGASIRWLNTGHGVNATPTATVTNGYGTAPDHGVISATWRNLNVFGHDGDHYGVTMTNSMLCTLENIRTYGGGGIEALTDSVSGNYGNLVVVHPFISLFCEGTAHGYHFDGSAASGGYGLLNLITMIRPQCNGQDVTAIFPTTVAPTTAQYLIRAGETHAVDRLSVIGPDFESPLSMPSDLGESRGHHIDVSGTPELAGTPTLTKKSNLGASTAVLNASASDNAGFIQVTAAAGLSTAYQSILTVEWEHRDSGNYDDIILITPKNGNAPSAQAYVEPVAGGFELRVAINLVSGESYSWYYAVTTGHTLNT